MNRVLHCFTDNSQCCHDRRIVKIGWFFPNGSTVNGDNFYRIRGQSVLSLNRRNNTLSPSGLYCCEIPDASSITIRVCANISKSLHLQI